MMRGVSTWAVAVRKPTEEQLAEGGPNSKEGAKGEIEVLSEPLVAWSQRSKLLRLPVVRGVVALGESLKIGFRALGISANAQVPPDDEGEKQEIGGGTWAGTVVFAILFAVGLFFLLPAGPDQHLPGLDPQLGRLRGDREAGADRDLPRLSGPDLPAARPPARVRVPRRRAQDDLVLRGRRAAHPRERREYSRFHPRCGTSFLLIVMIVAIFVFAPLGKLDWHWLFISRVVGIPLVAGLAFEVIKWFGRNRTKRWARALMWPGIQLQRLTTREPDLSQLAVAIAALEAVLAVEDPEQATEEERVGMEVVA